MAPVPANFASQAELIKRAFAGDDVVAEFSKEKLEAEKANDDDQEVNLPGWGGGFIGEGTITKPRIRKQPTIVDKPKQGKDHVILNPTADSNLKKYQIAKVPFGMDKRGYNQTLSLPLGKDWNASSGHRALIKPKHTVKTGVMIKPLKLTTSQKEQYEEHLKNNINETDR